MKNLILMFALLLVFSGCDRDSLPSGVESNIQGNISDKFNNIPF
jgi:hypothetical protein